MHQNMPAVISGDGDGDGDGWVDPSRLSVLWPEPTECDLG
jgi:hypothetical protein